MAVHPWMMDDAGMCGVKVAHCVRHWRYHRIDDNRDVGRRMMSAYLDGEHHRTEHENRRIVEVDVHDDDDHGIDDHNPHDTEVPALPDDDDHIPHTRQHYWDHHENGIRSRNFPLQAIHWVVVGDDVDVVVVDIPILVVVRSAHHHRLNDVMSVVRRHLVVRDPMDVVVVATDQHDDLSRTSSRQLQPRRPQKMGSPQSRSVRGWLSH